MANGTLNASGTAQNKITFTGAAKGSWIGVRFMSTGSGGTLNHCIIRNAVNAVYMESRSPSIQCCFIDDADNNGISINGSSSWPQIHQNYIEADVACVEHYNNGNGYFTHNSFRNAQYGVYVSSGTSSPRYDYQNVGRNKFESSISQDKVKVLSGQPWLGMNQYFTKPVSTTYKYINNLGSSTITATNNFWSVNQNPPDPPPSAVYFNGSVDRSSPLQYPPSSPSAGPSWTLIKSSGSDFFLTFEEVSKFFYEGKYAEAREIFKMLTEQYIESEYSSYSLNWYMLASEQLKELGIQEDYLKSIRQNKSAHPNTKFYALKWLLQLEMRNGTTTKAMNLASEVELGSVYDWELSLDLAVGLFEHKGDKQEAEKILNALSEKFTDSNSLEAIEFIRNHMNNQSFEGKPFGKIQAEKEIPDKYELMYNYPNPFNPATTIKYQIAALPSLPEKETFVSLKIFDILGREVTTLVNEMKKPGYYTVTFDASDLTSGIYIYKLQVNDFVSSKKMLLLK